MKKGILILMLSLLLAAMASSCKVVEPCPAYGASVEMSNDSDS